MDVLQTILPIFLLILTGFILRRTEFPSTGFWPQAERLTYYVLFPALLIDKLTSMHAGQQPVLPMAATIWSDSDCLTLGSLAPCPRNNFV